MKSPGLGPNEGTSLKKRLHINNRFLTFCLCLLIALFLWFFSALSKEYTTSFEIPLKYINFPKDKIEVSELVPSVRVLVNANGFRLMHYRIFGSPIEITTDLSQLKNENSKGSYSLVLSKSAETIREEFVSEVSIVRFIPDTLYFNFEKKYSRMVPVKVTAAFAFDEQYQALSEMRIRPEAVLVSGTRSLIEKIDTLHTQSLVLKKLTANVDTNVKLLTPQTYPRMDITPNVVNVFLPVDKFTEKEMEVPVVVMNVPEGYSVKIFPGQVKIKFLVPFSKYGKVKAEDFLVNADYSIHAEGNVLNVELNKVPDFVRQVRVIPSRIEYILVK